MKNKYYIVGSGIVGSVIARELAERGAEVVVWERRNHIGGNIYDFTDEHGIHVHMYGPHIFHTKIERVWQYVTKYCEFADYNLVCGSVIDGKCVPTAFDFKSIDIFFPDEAAEIKEHIKKIYGSQKSASILDMLDSDDEYIKKFAQFLYDKDYALYTAKQWGIEPNKVDKQVFKRVPILFSYDSKYFDDPHQGIPVNGYTELIKNLLNHKNILVTTGIEALDHLKIIENRILIDGKAEDVDVVYTGTIDELFECKFGELPYRSLRFEWIYEDKESFQDMPVVAYPQAQGFTRITEYKKLPYQNVKGTSYAVEYPLPYKPKEHNEPYYPVLTDNSCQLYEKYAKLADGIENLIYCGRLADFKYYNMDLAVYRALCVIDNID